MHRLSSSSRLILGATLSIVMLTVCACTLICIEGNSNRVTDTGGHETRIAVPASSPGIPAMPLAR